MPARSRWPYTPGSRPPTTAIRLLALLDNEHKVYVTQWHTPQRSQTPSLRPATPPTSSQSGKTNPPSPAVPRSSQWRGITEILDLDQSVIDVQMDVLVIGCPSERFWRSSARLAVRTGLFLDIMSEKGLGLSGTCVRRVLGKTCADYMRAHGQRRLTAHGITTEANCHLVISFTVHLS